jgi:hypothetical protein
MKTYFYKAIIEPAEEGGDTAYVPKLPGCVSEGETYEEAMANIKEALTPKEIASILEPSQTRRAHASLIFAATSSGFLAMA